MKLMKEVKCPQCGSAKFVYKTAEITKDKLILNEWICTHCDVLIKTSLGR